MFYRCPTCGSDKHLYALNPQIVSYHLTSNGKIDRVDPIDTSTPLTTLKDIRCDNCGNEGSAESFQLTSLSLKPSPKSDDDEIVTLTAVRTDHLVECPGCKTDIDIICIGTNESNESDDFIPSLMWCSCGVVWSNIAAVVKG